MISSPDGAIWKGSFTQPNDESPRHFERDPKHSQTKPLFATGILGEGIDPWLTNIAGWKIHDFKGIFLGKMRILPGCELLVYQQ